MRADFEDELVVRAAGGDEAARNALVRALEPRVRRSVQGRLFVFDRAQRTDDVVQEVLADVADGLARLRQRDKPSLCAFVQRVVERRVIDEFRRKPPVGLDRPLPLDESIRSLRDAVADPHTPSSSAGLQEEIQRLRERLARQRPQDRRLIEMAFFDDLSTVEIAALLGIERTAAAMRLARAIAKLRQG